MITDLLAQSHELRVSYLERIKAVYLIPQRNAALFLARRVVNILLISDLKIGIPLKFARGKEEEGRGGG